jgi:hypothetical protein
MKVTSVEIGGEQVAIDVDVSGRFHARYDDTNIGGDTLQEVKDQLAKMNRKTLDARAVPVTVIGIVPNEEQRKFGTVDPYVNGIGVLNALYRGKHARNGYHLLVADSSTGAERKKFNISTYGTHDRHQVICRRITLDETMEYLRLAKAAEYAKQQLDVWIKERRVDPKTLIKGDV